MMRFAGGIFTMRFRRVILLVLTASVLLASCTTLPTPEPATSTPEVAAGLPNPASVFCEEQGGQVDIRSSDDGGQAGYCVFPDGSECEEWAFFRGECAPEARKQTAVPTAPVEPARTEETDVPSTEACRLTAQSNIETYQRPHLQAEVWGTLSTGDQYAVNAKTADGWLGFEPGVAQAANIGVFRLRWVEEDAAITLEGECENLPVVAGPPPGVCFTMAVADTPVYTEADASSARLVTMQPPDDYAAVVAKTADANWLKLDLSVGSMGSDQTGWIEAGMANLNGPCDILPIIPTGNEQGGTVEPVPIVFEAGGTSAAVEGEISANGFDEYILSAQEGQLMEVSVDSPNNDVLLSIYGVSDGMPLVRTAADATTWGGLLPASQPYSIKAVSSGTSSPYTLFVRIPAPIRFSPDSSTAVIKGDLNAGQIVDYALHAQQGQTMKVTLTSPNNDVFLSIVAIEDGIPLIRFAADGTQWSGPLPATGIYRLSAFASGGSTAYTLEVTLPIQGVWRRFTTADGLCSDRPLFIGHDFIGTNTTTLCSLPENTDEPDWLTTSVPQGTRVTAAVRFPPSGGLSVAIDEGVCDDISWSRPNASGPVWECRTSEQGFPYTDIRGMVSLGVDPVVMLADSVAYNEQVYQIPDLVGATDARPTWIAVSGNYGRYPEIWVSTNGYGIVVIRPETEEIARHTTDNGLPGNDVRDVNAAVENDGSNDRYVSVATNSGVRCWDGVQWRAYTTADGLPSNDVRGISSAGGRRDNVWAATADGAAFFDGRSWRAFTRADGLPDGDLNGVTVTMRKDGTPNVWFSTRGSGLLLYIPDS
jgi:putative hemolysin